MLCWRQFPSFKVLLNGIPAFNNFKAQVGTFITFLLALMSKIDAPYTVYIGLTRHNLGCMCSSLGEDEEVDTNSQSTRGLNTECGETAL